MAVEAVVDATQTIFSYPTVLWMVLGVLAGIIIGAIPGIGPTIGMAVLIPLSVPMGPTNAIVFFICLYAGSLYGGCIPAILMNAPGTAGAGASTLDGYPLSRQGRAGDALAVSVTASAIGGFVTSVVLLLVTPFLVIIVLAFGSPEYFLVAILGLAMIAVIAKGDMVRAIVAGAFGLLLSTIGTAPMAVAPRYTFDLNGLFSGVSFVAVLIGVFAMAEMFKLASQEGTSISSVETVEINRSAGVKIVLNSKINLFKSSLIGMVIGTMPGAGASIANFVAYGEAQRSSSDPDSFGRGNPQGLVASESSNNAVVAGSLIPTFAFGIPGSGGTAVLLGALLLHGLQPGPDLFTSDINVTYSVFIALIFANVIIFAFGYLAITRLSLVTKVDVNYIIPVVIVLATVGTLALRNNWIDVATVAGFGIVGLVMVRNDYSIIALVLGVVLGPIVESNLHRSIQLHSTIPKIFYSSTIAAVMTLLTIVMLFGPFAKSLYVALRAR